MENRQYTYLNRDLSWLSFNHRVLLEAADETVPLYNRISFLSIFSSNLDEFFRVRMPAIYAFSRIPAKKISLRDEYPKDLVQKVQETVHNQLEQFGRILTGQVLPALKQNNIHLYYGDVVLMEHREHIREYFLSRVLSFLQPVLLRKEKRQDVFLENNAIYFLIDLEAGSDKPGTHSYAVLNIPSDHLPRFMELPPVNGMNYILFLDDAIRLNLQELFPGFIIHGSYAIKLTRDAEMAIEDEYQGDIAEKIEKQLSKRDLGHTTRFLYESSMPEHVREFAKQFFELNEDEMVEGGIYHNLKDLGNLPHPEKKGLKYEEWPPIPHPGLHQRRSIFQSITEKERILHLPYHSYNYILRFFNEAAIDPGVEQIYVTLYRVAADSHIANALISAAKNGKKVTVFVELKARFDEANNLRWSKKMKAAGIRIINSIPGLKVHAKTALIKRWVNKHWEYYSLMATGNFNEVTGRFYSDHVLFSSSLDFGKELEMLFDYLQTRKQPEEYGKIPFRHLLVSRFNMVKHFSWMIGREMENARQGKPAHIIIKVNNLQEKEMITRLYDASNAGVRIDLLIRSICCLAAGIPGQSENITVRRIVDRYLEHARIFYFHNNGDPEYFLGSADWMYRNLYNRIEVCFPLYDKKLCSEIEQILNIQLHDNRKAVLVDPLLENKPIAVDGEQTFTIAQESIYNYVKENAVVMVPMIDDN